MAYTRVNWENSPSIDTPINSDNLNIMDAGIAELDNVTKYITATATTNGDFKINISNTLTTGMILNITFPTATVGTANARLSIDNGNTYKDVKGANGAPLTAVSLQNTCFCIYYNGTNFICEKAKALIFSGFLGPNTEYTTNYDLKKFKNLEFVLNDTFGFVSSFVNSIETRCPLFDMLQIYSWIFSYINSTTFKYTTNVANWNQIGAGLVLNNDSGRNWKIYGWN